MYQKEQRAAPGGPPTAQTAAATSLPLPLPRPERVLAPDDGDGAPGQHGRREQLAGQNGDWADIGGDVLQDGAAAAAVAAEGGRHCLFAILIEVLCCCVGVLLGHRLFFEISSLGPCGTDLRGLDTRLGTQFALHA